MPATKFKPGANAPSPLPYRSEKEVMSTWKSHERFPLVSICCATYNHVDLLTDALNGFLGQITSFPFEIIIRDDASTDGTTDIVLDYAARFPRIVRVVIETENQHSKGIRATPALVPLAKGEFIALCEGDDFWIMPDKLEKQVQLLRTYPQATMSVAQTVVCRNENGRLVCGDLFIGNDKDLQHFDDIRSTYFHTSTYLIRAHLYRDVLSKYANKIEYGDTSLRYMLVYIGPFALLKEVASVYRVTGRGIWTSLDQRKQLAWEIKATESLYRHFDATGYRRHFGVRLFHLYKLMLRHNSWSFNNRRPIANFMRLSYFFLAYGVNSYGQRLSRLIRRV